MTFVDGRDAGVVFLSLLTESYNLGQNKKEQLTPFPQSNDEGAKEQKRAILASLK